MAKSKHPRKLNRQNLQNQTQKRQNPNYSNKTHPRTEKPNTPSNKTEKPQSWAALRSLFTCKQLEQQQQNQKSTDEISKRSKKVRCSGSLCSNTRVTQRPDLSTSSLSSSPEEHHQKKKRGPSVGSPPRNNNSNRSIKTEFNGGAMISTSTSTSTSSSSSNSLSVSSNSLSVSGSFRGMPFRKLSGCYECRMVVDPLLGFTRDPSLRGTICSCPQCGEVFMKAESLELHQSVRHAVSELDPEDTSKNIVEIIFQSSWLKKQSPVCRIDRILKVENTPKTISRFEEYRDAVKAKATKKHPRCVADGNELLRFHCATFVCSLGLNGSSNLCNSIPNCNVCSIIKNGFRVAGQERGILTTATSGRAHDRAGSVAADDEKRAMLVCRVIAGRVRKSTEASPEEYDSVAGAAGVYSNLDELFVFNRKAILPCFVVIYGGFH